MPRYGSAHIRAADLTLSVADIENSEYDSARQPNGGTPAEPAEPAVSILSSPMVSVRLHVKRTHGQTTDVNAGISGSGAGGTVAADGSAVFESLTVGTTISYDRFDIKLTEITGSGAAAAAHFAVSESVVITPFQNGAPCPIENP